MKGLLLKEFYLIKKYCRAFLLVVVVFIGFSAVEPDNFFLMVYPGVLAGVVPVTLLSCDEREKWDRYSAVLPYTRTQIVSSKYLIGLAVSAAVSVMAILAQALYVMQGGAFAPQDFLGKCGIVFALGLLTPVAVLPFSFKWGTEKGRIIYYVCIIGICAAGGILGGSGIQIPDLPHFAFGSLLLPAAMLVLYMLSWRLSIHFYQNREL